MAEFKVLLGKTITSVLNLEQGSESIQINCSDGSVYRMSHVQDCCESIRLVEITGDVNDIIGQEIFIAEESCLEEPHNSEELWTFYKLATIKGYLDLRWQGTSTGYYSMSVDFEEVPHILGNS